jgi:hypothetical protein
VHDHQGFGGGGFIRARVEPRYHTPGENHLVTRQPDFILVEAGWFAQLSPRPVPVGRQFIDIVALSIYTKD